MQSCLHATARKFPFEVPYLGKVEVCLPCRRELALRTIERPRGLAPLDCGGLGYQCRKCVGQFTSTDAMTCTCPGRKEDCEHAAAALKELLQYNELLRTK